ncbi:MAG: SixA phosphatase family protein [Candidatus Nanopelagicales bacterium]
MPSRLLLLRHAKSDYPLGISDHDRPLNERGLRDAQAAGRWIAENRDELFSGEAIAMVSSALRAQQTWGLIEEQLPDLPSMTEPRLYEAACSTLMSIADSSDADTVLIVAHNPTIEETTLFLAAPNGLGLADRIRSKYPTCGLVVLDLSPVDPWAGGSADLAAFEVPRA